MEPRLRTEEFASSQPTAGRTWLSSYALVYGVLAGVMAASLWQAYDRPLFIEDPPRSPAGAAGAPAMQVTGRIDPNTAAWHELSLLPGIGRAIAERIIAHRHALQLEWREKHPHLPADQAPPMFVKPEDLLAVKGIGPKTLEKIREHLALPETSSQAQPTPEP